MLNKLIIKNVALIDSAEIEFDKGLNVLSGETGSGKSVILESLNFALGAKADKSLIRSGENECFVSAEFCVNDNKEVLEVFNEFDFEYDDTLIISRKFTLDGKNTIKINGNTATVGMLKRFTALLVDVHGQSEHYYLLKTAHQLDLLDKIGGEDLSKIKNLLKELYAEYKNLLKEIDLLGGDDSQREFRLDILNFQINEIETCSLKEDEENELLEIKSKLLNQEKITYALQGVKNAISFEGGVSDILGNAVKNLSSICAMSEEYSSLYERLSSVYSEIDDICDNADNCLENIDFGEQSLDKIEERLDEIKKIKRKYGADYNAVMDFLDKAREEKDKLEHFNERADKLLSDKVNVEKKLYSYYLELSNFRKVTAQKFSQNILDELKELNINKASFYVEFNDFPSIDDCKFNGSNGIDDIKFMFSANFGEPAKPLSEVISGGEMSRFMLAIKTQTAKFNNISTFVFDEIDAGISGAVARTVAEKFAKISINTQVIAITHLPQISAMADNNLLIVKTESGEKTFTKVTRLDEESKLKEIIRLVAGDENSSSSISHAKEIIDKANEFKNNIIK